MMKTLLSILLLILVLPAFLFAADSQKKNLKKGAILSSSAGQQILVCRSRDKCKEYANAVKLGRQGQIDAMKKNNNNFLVPSDSPVKVINFDPAYCKIRVSTGQYKNKTGCVATALLKATIPSKKKN